MEQVLITGGTGLVGEVITQLLQEQGYKVIFLSRSADASAPIPRFGWSPSEGKVDYQAFEGTDHIIHLAGAGVADERWTPSRKKVLYNSRIDSTRLLYTSLKDGGFKPKTFIAASAVGFYGSRGDEWLKEDAAPADTFLAKICKDWEAESQKLAELGSRLCINRIGIVLSDEGGALKEIMQTAQFGFVSYLGSGEQYYPWIHIRDLARIFLHQIQNEQVQGIFNAVGPDPVTNKELTKEAVKASGKHALVLPAPSFALKIALGEMADMVLASQQCSNEKLVESGFKYKYPNLKGALKDLLA
jgi:uncharacterized protein (TIGR01777 family)